MIIEFKHQGVKFKGEFLESQKTIFDEEIIKLKLVSVDNNDLLKLNKNKLLLIKNGLFLKAYTEKPKGENIKKEDKVSSKLKSKSCKSRNLNLF